MDDRLDDLAAGLALHRAGDHQAAEVCYRAILQEQPCHSLALYLLGLLLLEAGAPAAAAELLTRASDARPDHSGTRLALADALAASGDTLRAEVEYRLLLAARRDDIGGLVNLANLLCGERRWHEAADLCTRTLRHDPTSRQAMITLSRARLGAGNPEGALSAATDAVANHPKDAAPRAAHATAALQAGDHATALHSADAAISWQPTLAEAWFVRGTALRHLGRADAALAALNRALALDPDHVSARINRANARADLDDLDGAEADLRCILADDPRNAAAWSALGVVLTTQGSLVEAIAACDTAIAGGGDNATYFSRGVAQLLSGNFPAGFRDHERRRKPRFLGREWLGESLEGRSIVVYSSQGMGDAIQLCRFLRPLRAQGARVTLASPPALARLLGQLPVQIAQPQGTQADLHVDLMSLPHLLRITQTNIPQPKGYLTAEPGLETAWDNMLPSGPRVGIVWAGNPAHRNDARRSLPSPALSPIMAALAELRVAPVNLQTASRGRELAWHTGRQDQLALSDLAETAAVIANLDLVIAADTCVAHLAGALGRPVWTMLPHAPDWRWMMEREDTPWYGTMRLFRQPRPGDWTAVTNEVAAALHHRFAPAGGRPNRVGQKRAFAEAAVAH